MEENLLENDVNWLPYSGEKLSIEDFVQVIKIKVDTHYPAIDTSILSADEIDKGNRFVHQHDRESYLVSKYYLRLLLSRFLHLANSAITYSYTSHRKPALSGIEFNLSHAGNYVVIAVSQLPVGVDIEFIKKDFKFMDLMEMCFSEEESSFILSNEDQLSSFFLLWTRKEAILKATGEGLTDHLHLVPSLATEVHRQGQLFKVQSIEVSDDYIVTAAFHPQENTILQFWNWE
ncbi:4'-phosphopantetheinyl transferase superfamily protein [Pedobacter sp. L105]|uniref:4'-phosphopantetheinyl transferase family protein n=1 Tax=Pedobacter sp. L105 TaxID=1641871 RepID=UPI00131B6AFE|nr:4'-phosphopantetheinyl transferase superfamily protein [Pedobacter sp. L105]